MTPTVPGGTPHERLFNLLTASEPDHEAINAAEQDIRSTHAEERIPSSRTDQVLDEITDAARRAVEIRLAAAEVSATADLIATYSIRSRRGGIQRELISDAVTALQAQAKVTASLIRAAYPEVKLDPDGPR